MAIFVKLETGLIFFRSMGKGANACKRNQARDRKDKSSAKEPKSQLKSNVAAMTVKCQICLQPFMPTQNRSQLQSHIDGKHSSKSFEECFPTYIGS